MPWRLMRSKTNSGAPPAKVTMEGEDFVLPTAEGGGFAGLQASANDLLDKVNTIPFDQIGKNLDAILKSVSDLARAAPQQLPLGAGGVILRQRGDPLEQLAAAGVEEPPGRQPLGIGGQPDPRVVAQRGGGIRVGQVDLQQGCGHGSSARVAGIGATSTADGVAVSR